MDKQVFHWADYLIFGLSLAISMAIGVYFAVSGSKQQTISEYFMGNRNMKVIPVAASILVTFVSGIDILGNPAEVYSYGSMYSLYVIAVLIGCTLSAFIMVPLFYPLQLTSVNEYYELRFGSKILRWIISLLSLISFGFINGVLLFGPAIALGAVSNIPVWATIVVVGIAGTIYTTIGGIKAVVWTDCFQCIVVIAGLLAVAIQGTIKVGGLKRVWELNAEWKRIKYIDLDIDPTKRMTLWSIILLNSLLWICISCAQPTVQRYCSLPTMRKAKIAILMNSPSFFISGSLTCFIGLVAFAYYADKGCDPVQMHLIYNPNQILPYFVLDVLNVPGLTGLFIACLFSASLSSLSSAINSMAAITYEDFLKDKIKHLSEKRRSQITKFTVCLYGLLGIAMAFVVKELGGSLIQIVYSIVGSLFGPILGTLIVGASMPKVGKRGVLIALTISLALSMWLGIGSTISGSHAPPLPAPTEGCQVTNETWSNGTNGHMYDYSINSNNSTGKTDITSDNYHLFLHGLDRFYAISFLLYPGIGILSVIIISSLTLLIPALHQKGPVDGSLIFPGLRSICCCGVKRSSDHGIDDKEELKHLKSYEMGSNDYH